MKPTKSQKDRWRKQRRLYYLESIIKAGAVCECCGEGFRPDGSDAIIESTYGMVPSNHPNFGRGLFLYHMHPEQRSSGKPPHDSCFQRWNRRRTARDIEERIPEITWCCPDFMGPSIGGPGQGAADQKMRAELSGWELNPVRQETDAERMAPFARLEEEVDYG